MSLQVMSVVPLEKGKARIRFDDGTEVVLYKGEIRKLGIEEGCVVTEAVYDKILNEILGKRAIKRAMHLLEKQDRTERQLYDKLKQNGYPESCIESAIAYVKSYHYIDDFRYASTYIRYHQEKKSRQKLKMELMAKGIGRDLVDAALEEEYVSKQFIIKASNTSRENKYIQSAKLNGKKLNSFKFPAKELLKGGTLELEMVSYYILFL